MRNSMFTSYQLPVIPFSFLKSKIAKENHIEIHMHNTQSLTFTPQSPPSIIYSEDFSDCTGVVSITKNQNSFQVSLSHFTPASLNDRYFDRMVKPYLRTSSNTEHVIFCKGEYQKNIKGQWEMQPREDYNTQINKLSLYLKGNIIKHAYDSSIKEGKPSNSIACIFEAQSNSIKVYTDGYNENPDKPILEVK